MIIFNEPSNLYHANAAYGSSDIRDFLRSPRLFADRQNGILLKETPAMVFGGLAHMAILEPDRFATETVAKPPGCNFSMNKWKDWREEQKLANKVIVDDEDRTTVTLMIERMPHEVRKMLSGGNSEVTVRTKIGNLDVQCRPDYWSGDRRTKYDLKTVAAVESIEKNIYKLSYHVQDRWYARVIFAETGVKVPSSRLLFVEHQAPFRWRVVELDVDYLMMAEDAIDRALAGIEARTKSGCWDDPSDIHLMASPPAWAVEETDDTDEEEVA